MANVIRIGGGGASLTLLWENPNPNVDFGAQVVSFSNNESFDYLAIVYRTYSTQVEPYDSKTVVFTPFGRNIALLFTEGNNSYYSRQFDFDTKYFTNSVHITGQFTANHTCVPIEIYGMNDSSLLSMLERSNHD